LNPFITEYDDDQASCHLPTGISRFVTGQIRIPADTDISGPAPGAGPDRHDRPFPHLPDSVDRPCRLFYIFNNWQNRVKGITRVLEATNS